jgi:hypothetical protein
MAPAELGPCEGASHAAPESDHSSEMPAVRRAGAAGEGQRDHLDILVLNLAPAARQERERHREPDGAEHWVALDLRHYQGSPLTGWVPPLTTSSPVPTGSPHAAHTVRGWNSAPQVCSKMTGAAPGFNC